MTEGFSRKQKPEWREDKGIKLIRVGGLSHVKQGNSGSPKRIRKGLWAFIYPHFDWWFVSGSFSHKNGKTKDPNQWREHIFWHKGDIFTRIDLRTIGKADACTSWDDRWFLTDDSKLYNCMSKLYAADLKDLKQTMFGPWKVQPGEYQGNPYYGSSCVQGTDHMEVFIPRRKKVR